MTDDEMVERQDRLDRHEFEQTLSVGDGQGSFREAGMLKSMGSQRIGPNRDTELN